MDKVLAWLSSAALTELLAGVAILMEVLGLNEQLSPYWRPALERAIDTAIIAVGLPDLEAFASLIAETASSAVA